MDALHPSALFVGQPSPCAFPDSPSSETEAFEEAVSILRGTYCLWGNQKAVSLMEFIFCRYQELLRSRTPWDQILMSIDCSLAAFLNANADAKRGLEKAVCDALMDMNQSHLMQDAPLSKPRDFKPLIDHILRNRSSYEQTWLSKARGLLASLMGSSAD